jgi:hypothetical protein
MHHAGRLQLERAALIDRRGEPPPATESGWGQVWRSRAGVGAGHGPGAARRGRAPGLPGLPATRSPVRQAAPPPNTKGLPGSHGVAASGAHLVSGSRAPMPELRQAGTASYRHFARYRSSSAPFAFLDASDGCLQWRALPRAPPLLTFYARNWTGSLSGTPWTDRGRSSVTSCNRERDRRVPSLGPVPRTGRCSRVDFQRGPNRRLDSTLNAKDALDGCT